MKTRILLAMGIAFLSCISPGCTKQDLVNALEDYIVYPFPNIRDFEKFQTAKLQRVTIRYRYYLDDVLQPPIAFTITDKDVITELQKSVQIENVERDCGSPEEGLVSFTIENVGRGAWVLEFIDKKDRVRMRYRQNGRRKYPIACVARLHDESFYEKVFQLVYDFHKRLEPECPPEDIWLYNYDYVRPRKAQNSAKSETPEK